MRLPLVQLALGCIVTSMQIVLMILMVKRRVRSEFPLFFTLLAATSVAAMISWGAYSFAGGQYFYIYWSMNAIVMFLGLGVLYESHVNIMKPFSAISDFGKMLFWWAGLFLLVTALLTASVTSGSAPKRIVAVVDLCDRCVHLMQGGLLLLLVFFQKRLNLSWRTPGMFVALGIGLTSALDLMVSYAQSMFPALSAQFDIALNVGYVGVLAMWASMLLNHQPAPSAPEAPGRRLILQRWNEALAAYGYGHSASASTANVESFLPGIERTVDRVLARKAIH